MYISHFASRAAASATAEVSEPPLPSVATSPFSLITSGYANGKTKNPKYQDLHSSGHAETVHVKYDASKVNLSTLLKYYFKIIDPTSVNKQGNDRGSQYRKGIYYVIILVPLRSTRP